MLMLILAHLRNLFPLPFLLSALLFVSFPGYAETEIRIAFNNALTPYSIEKSENGIELDIVQEALKKAGYKLAPVFGSIEQKISLYDKKSVDGISTVNKDSSLVAHYSEPYVTFENVVITLKSRELSINSLQDLIGIKISAFKGATHYLGNEFQQFAKNNPLYSETSQPFDQSSLLLEGKVDAIIIDRTIFTYMKQLYGSSATGKPWLGTVMHPIFSKVRHCIGFHDVALRNKFNAGLKQLNNDDIEMIYARYQETIKFNP